MRRAVIAWICIVSITVSVRADDLNAPPIEYAKAPAENAVSRLQHQLATGKAKLHFTEDHGYLKSVLAALDVPESSQVLVFSKTSLQRDRIAPRTPRAIYFNDDVYVGFCLHGEVMELSAVDPSLGTVFYTLEQEPAERPRFTRQTENCLICHGSSLTRSMPGHVVRSVTVDRGGMPYLSAGSHRTDYRSPFAERWGGWYVTGTHGKMTHRGNCFAPNKKAAEEGFDFSAGQNVTSLRPYFTNGMYLTPHSDIVALMTLEHQTEMHNRIAQATIDVRCALHYNAELNKAFDEPASHRFDSTASRIRTAGDNLLKALLLSEEAELTDRVTGTSSFARDFAARGPKDSKGRSLREFDLNRRLFKYPCSYLIYSQAFDRMPGEVREYVLKRLFAVLRGEDPDKAFCHLSAGDRQAILEILRDTKPNLPDYWRASEN
ncbi:MAG TPA: hypothetical protein VLM40_06515 [Gemmata sp.]|nr:hypothetical protein [Gemmata sp.]